MRNAVFRRSLHVVLVTALSAATILGAHSASAGGNGVGVAPALADQNRTFAGAGMGGPARPARPHPFYTAGLLTYHGGPVMHQSKVHLLFWDGTGTVGGAFPAGYINGVLRYFKDVAHDSGKRSNVYAIAKQYSGTNGTARYKVSVPTLCHHGSGCFKSWVFSDAYDNTCPTTVSYPFCVTDASMRTEVAFMQSFLHVPSGVNDITFVILPPGVNTCFGASCYATPDFCAYHSSFTGTSGTEIYANMPYVVGNGGCDVFQYPSGRLSDGEASVLSHEHNEAITDPIPGSGWYNGDLSHENGDQCAYTFANPDPIGYNVSTGSGAVHGASGTYWNQKINGHKYLLQEEWSNSRFGATGVGCYQHK